MKLTPEQVKLFVDTFIGKERQGAIKSTYSSKYLLDAESPNYKRFQGKNEIVFEKDTFDLLNACRVRIINRCIRGAEDYWPRNFLAGSKKGIISTVVPLEHKGGCGFFSPVEYQDFSRAMYHLTVNDYRPCALVRVCYCEVSASIHDRVEEAKSRGFKQLNLPIVSFGIYGVRAEELQGDMTIRIAGEEKCLQKKEQLAVMK